MSASAIYAIAYRLHLPVSDVWHTTPGVILDTMCIINPHKADISEEGGDE